MSKKKGSNDKYQSLLKSISKTSDFNSCITELKNTFLKTYSKDLKTFISLDPILSDILSNLPYPCPILLVSKNSLIAHGKYTEFCDIIEQTQDPTIIPLDIIIKLKYILLMKGVINIIDSNLPVNEIKKIFKPLDEILMPSVKLWNQLIKSPNNLIVTLSITKILDEFKYRTDTHANIDQVAINYTNAYNLTDSEAITPDEFKIIYDNTSAINQPDYQSLIKLLIQSNKENTIKYDSLDKELKERISILQQDQLIALDLYDKTSKKQSKKDDPVKLKASLREVEEKLIKTKEELELITEKLEKLKIENKKSFELFQQKKLTDENELSQLLHLKYQKTIEDLKILHEKEILEHQSTKTLHLELKKKNELTIKDLILKNKCKEMLINDLRRQLDITQKDVNKLSIELDKGKLLIMTYEMNIKENKPPGPPGPPPGPPPQPLPTVLPKDCIKN